jgi:hypothetical protein
LPQAVSLGEQVSGTSGYRSWKTFSRSSPYAVRLNSLATLSMSELVRSNLNHARELRFRFSRVDAFHPA